MDRTKLAKRIDHTCLRAEATEADILRVCKEALEHGFRTVFVNPCRVQIAVKSLSRSEVRVGSVVGFPLGAAHTSVKVAEAQAIVSDGASEIDMVMNIGWLKESNYRGVADDIRQVRLAVGEEIVLKVVIETALLSDLQKRLAPSLVIDAGADFVKTSTGLLSGGGATLEDVRLLREIVGERGQVKAAGGIRDAQTAVEMIGAGADRIGTSAGVAIMRGG